MTPRELAKAAAELTLSGLWVHPVGADKRPCSQHGLHDAVDRPERAEKLFLEHRNAAAIGVPMGVKTMLVGIDVDPAGRDWLRGNWSRLGNTLMHRTPRGGVHLCYKMPLPPYPIITSRQVCDGQPLLGRGVDIQGEGRSMIWPPSPGYTVVNEVPAAAMPAWMLRRILRQPRKPPQYRSRLAMPHDVGRFDGALRTVQYGRRGNRNNLVFWGGCVGGELVAKGLLSEDEAIRLVAVRGIAAGLPELEAWRSAKSGVLHGSRTANSSARPVEQR